MTFRFIFMVPVYNVQIYVPMLALLHAALALNTDTLIASVTTYHIYQP